MIRRIANSKWFQNLIVRTKNKKFYDNLGRNLPLVETAYATSWYCIVTARNKDIPPERKPALQYQNLMGGLLAVTLSKAIDSMASKHKEKICQSLEKMYIPNSKNVIKGARLAVPLIITSLCTRYLTSTLSVYASTYMASKHRDRKNKLDIVG